jgi:hypothetical protein
VAAAAGPCGSAGATYGAFLPPEWRNGNVQVAATPPGMALIVVPVGATFFTAADGNLWSMVKKTTPPLTAPVPYPK